MFSEVVKHHGVHVHLGALALADAVTAIRIGHEVELPVVFDQLINQSSLALPSALSILALLSALSTLT